ncbi:MAG: hypothetical protein CR988_04300 [Treponema sp.]|nr:MAG: hypothetical protein CR988_04300 [Treponema sp.]
MGGSGGYCRCLIFSKIASWSDKRKIAISIILKNRQEPKRGGNTPLIIKTFNKIPNFGLDKNAEIL